MSVDKKMPGDYEYMSLHHGPSIQKQWNKNRLILISVLNFITKDDVVLDAGCGSGNAVIEFAKKSKKIEGWDLNEKSILHLRLIIQNNKINNAKARKINLMNYSVKQKFDKIIVTEVVEHFSRKNYEKMINNLGNSLTDNGRLFITTPNDRSYWPILEKILNFYLKKSGMIPTLDDRHLGHFDEKKLQKTVQKAGFKIVESGTLNHISPFAFFLSNKMRRRLCIWESKNLKFGPLIYLIAEKNEK